MIINIPNISRPQKNNVVRILRHWGVKQVKDNAEGVLGRIYADGLSIQSEWNSIVKVLEPVVAPDFCIAMAWVLKFKKINEAENMINSWNCNKQRKGINMKKVSKKEFFKFVGPKDAILEVIGNYPYTTIYKERYGSEIGRVVDTKEDGKPFPISHYYLKN